MQSLETVNCKFCNNNNNKNNNPELLNSLIFWEGRGIVKGRWKFQEHPSYCRRIDFEHFYKFDIKEYETGFRGSIG